MQVERLITNDVTIKEWCEANKKSESAGRLRTGSLLICSQFSSAGWHKKLGEGAIADVAIDCIVYRPEIIHIEGDESMRKRIG